MALWHAPPERLSTVSFCSSLGSHAKSDSRLLAVAYIQVCMAPHLCAPNAGDATAKTTIPSCICQDRVENDFILDGVSVYVKQ